MNKKTTYHLFKRWLQGDVNLEAQRQLMKEAKNDPFIEEAIEGYSDFPEGTHLDRIASINSKVKSKHRKRRAGGYWSRIAATIALLFVLSAGFWWINHSNIEQVADKTEIIENNKERVTKAEETAIPPAVEKEVSEDKIENHQEPSKTVKRQKKAQREVRPMPKPKQTDVSTNVVISTDTLTSQNPIAYLDEQMSDYDESIIKLEQEGQLSTKSMEPATINTYSDDISQKKDMGAAEYIERVVAGQVIDGQTGEPLIGATLLEKGTSNGTTSNIEGYFSLALTNDNAILNISYTGFSDNELSVSKGDTIVGTLYAGEALDEVVVTSSSERRSSKTMDRPSTSSKPVEGFSKYRKYIKHNLQYPDEAARAGIKGEVILSFTVDFKGQPQGIQLERSLGYGCDEEAIRLLKEGPKWERTNARIRYTIDFK